jgi:hypothetical protein
MHWKHSRSGAWSDIVTGRSVKDDMCVPSSSHSLDRKTLSSLEKDGDGRLLDHINCQPCSGISYRSRSEIKALNASMECVLGFEAVVSVVSRRMLKLPNMIHGRSCRQYIMHSSFRKACFRLLSIGPYTLVSMKLIPRLLVRTIVLEKVRTYEWFRVSDRSQAMIVPSLKPLEGE